MSIEVVGTQVQQHSNCRAKRLDGLQLKRRDFEDREVELKLGLSPRSGAILERLPLIRETAIAGPTIGPVPAMLVK